MDSKYDVFISYSRKDLEVVKGIKEEIERATNAHCWMDLQGIESGAPRFIRSIIDGINMCDVFLFMRSKQSQVSKYIRFLWPLPKQPSCSPRSHR